MDTTVDSIIEPSIKICQPASGGFRFGCDSPLLSYFAGMKKNWLVADIGSGSGIIAVLAAKMYGVKVIAVELQEEMYYCLERSIILSRAQDKITPVKADIKTYRPSVKFDAVICNPPYRKTGSGRVSLAELEKTARFSLTMNLEDAARFCRISLKHGGKFYFCYDADMLVEAMCVCRGVNLEPKRIRFVHPEPYKAARLAMIECAFGAGEEIKVDPPLFQREINGPSKEYENIFAGRWQV